MVDVDRETPSEVLLTASASTVGLLCTAPHASETANGLALVAYTSAMSESIVHSGLRRLYAKPDLPDLQQQATLICC